MNQPTTIAGYRILDGRYALLECIAISNTGKIYRGRDLERARTQGMDSHVLIHFLPYHLDTLPLETLFQQVTQSCKQITDKHVLPLRSYGQEQNKRYLVMDSPATTVITSLEQHSPGQNENLYRQLSRLIQPLHKQGVMTAHVDSALVVTDAGHSPYLLSSALSPEIQALQSRHAVFSGKRKPFKALAAGFTVLGLVSAISVMAANYIITPDTQANTVATTAQPKIRDEKLGITPVQLELASLAPSTYEATVDLTNSDRVIPTTRSEYLETEPTPEDREKKSALRTEVKPEPPKPKKTAATKPATKPPAKPVKQPKAVDKTVKQARKASKPVKTANLQQARPAPAPETKPEKADVNQLIKLAEQAMSTGKFTGQKSALYYTRLLRKQSHLHPQVKRLSRAIASHFHSQVRAHLQNQDINAAERYLATSVSVIKEFNLVSFNAAQQVLEHKAASMRSSY